MMRANSDNGGSDVAVAAADGAGEPDAGSRSIQRFRYYEALRSCGSPPRS